MGILARRNSVGQECPTYMLEFDNASGTPDITVVDREREHGGIDFNGRLAPFR